MLDFLAELLDSDIYDYWDNKSPDQLNIPTAFTTMNFIVHRAFTWLRADHGPELQELARVIAAALVWIIVLAWTGVRLTRHAMHITHQAGFATGAAVHRLNDALPAVWSGAAALVRQAPTAQLELSWQRRELCLIYPQAPICWDWSGSAGGWQICLLA